MKLTIQFRNMDFVRISCFSVIYALFASISYGRSYWMFFLATIVACYFAWIPAFINYYKINQRVLCALLLVIMISIFNGLLNGDVIDALAMSNSLLLGLSLSTYDFQRSNNYKYFIPVCVLTLSIVFLQIQFNILGFFNVNVLGFILYMGGSFLFVWLRSTKHKLTPFMLIIFLLYLMSKTDCRNAVFVTILCAILACLPSHLITKRIVLRTIYIVSLSYTIFVIPVINFIFSNIRFSSLVNLIAGSFTQKTYGMDLRLAYYSHIIQEIKDLNIYSKLFGCGVNTLSGHNMMFQSVYIYGIFGTVIIYIMFIYIFERAINQIMLGDNMTIGLFIALVGNILLQGADEYLICNPTCVFVPFVIIGLILSKDRLLMNHCLQENNLTGSS